MSDDEEVKFAVVRVKGKQKAVGLLNILVSCWKELLGIEIHPMKISALSSPSNHSQTW